MTFQICPYPLGRIEFRAVWRQMQERDVVRNAQAVGDMPAGLVQDQYDVFVRPSLAADELQVGVHVVGVDRRSEHGRGVAREWIDGGEQIDPVVLGLPDRRRT